MLSFPNAKINIGLHVIRKRADGYHDIETVFCPLTLCDILEFVPAGGKGKGIVNMQVTGIALPGTVKDNLVAKAYDLLAGEFDLPPVSVHLHKIIPVGAGLGGGSADAAFMLKSLNRYFELKLNDEGLCRYASMLGSDCAFFILNRPVAASGRGDRFTELGSFPVDLKVVLVTPNIHISTGEAYAGVTPRPVAQKPEELVRIPLEDWKNHIFNDFEKSILPKHPFIKAIKEKLYDLGAVYASMSGSGSSVYGLFERIPDIQGVFEGCFVWTGTCLIQ